MNVRIFSLLAILTLLGIAACSQSNGQEPPQAKAPRRAVPVTAGMVEARSVPLTLSAIGNVQSAETVEVKSQVGGQLTAVHFTEGQDVKKGDPLFTLDDRAAAADLAEAEAKLDHDVTLMNKAKEDNRRYERLVAEHVISPEAYEEVSTNLAALMSTIRADQAAVESARVALSYTVITSPISGRTGQLLAHAGNMIKANADTAMVVIQKIEPIQVGFSVPEEHLSEIMGRMKSGAKLTVTAKPSGQNAAPAAGVLTFVDNAVDTKTGTIRLKATFDNADRRLWPGQFVEVTLTLGNQAQAVIVSSQAVQAGAQGSYVYVIKPDMTVESRTVKIGRTVGDDSLIESGLAPGEQVVLDGQLRLGPGALVEIKAPGAEAPGATGKRPAESEAAGGNGKARAEAGQGAGQ